MSTVQGVNSGYTYNAQNYTKAAEKETSKDTAAKDTAKDVVEIGKDTSAVDSKKQTYSPDMVTANYLKSVAQKNADTLRQMVEKLLGSQGFAAEGKFSQSFSAWGSLKADNEIMMSFGFEMSFSAEFSFSFDNVDEATQEEAASLISEDGPLGVKQVSENILGFAKAISGGDPSKIDMLRKATQRGFDEVAKIFGGWDKLPDITKETHEAVMKGFDDWKSETSASEE